MHDRQRRVGRPTCMFGPLSLSQTFFYLPFMSTVGGRLKCFLVNERRRPPCLASSSRRSGKGTEQRRSFDLFYVRTEFLHKAWFPSKLVVYNCRYYPREAECSGPQARFLLTQLVLVFECPTASSKTQFTHPAVPGSLQPSPYFSTPRE